MTPAPGNCPFGAAHSSAPRPPKARGHPLIGNTWQIFRQPWRFIQEAYRTHGPAYRVSIKGNEAVVLGGPEVRELYSGAGDGFLDRAFFYDRLRDELGARELIFQTRGERHRIMRRCAALAFSRHIAAAHVPAAAAEMLRLFDALVPGRRYDVLQLASHSLILAAGPILGASDLRPIMAEATDYVCTMMEVSGQTRSRLALFHPRYRRAKRVTHRFARTALRRWRDADPSDGATCILGCLADVRDDRGDRLGDADLVALTLLALVGVGVYINRVVAFMLYELFRDDDLRRSVATEVDDAFAGGISYQALKEMRLLRAVYCEALRLYPIWFLVPFRAEQPFVFAGRRIDAGDGLLLSSVQEHFLPRYYADPQRFDPERCRPPRNEHLRYGAFAPFGFGSRRCIAEGQTEILSLLCVALLVHRCRFTTVGGHRLRVRLKPLPGPHRFKLRFEGIREVTSTPRTILRPSPMSTLAQTADRISVEDAAALDSAIDREMEVVVFAADTEAVRQGDHADAFYIIERGEAVVTRRDEAGDEQRLATLGPGDIFGEIGLLHRRPRSATVRASAAGPLVTLQCSTAAFERLLGELNIVGEELIALIRQRKVAASIARLAPTLDRTAIADLIPDASFKPWRAGDIVVREGDPADAMYVIERGQFEVVTGVPAEPGAEQLLARLGSGDFFGEMGLIGDAPRSATVRVARDCEDAETLVVGRATFARLLEPDAGFRERLFLEISRRMEDTRGRRTP